MPNRPNILLLFTDQQRFDTIAALGNPHIKTPHLDRLVKSGVAFTSAYSPSPVCVPARCSMHYGQYPMHTGCYENGYKFPSDRKSFVQALTETGYRTHAVGKCHFTPDKFGLRGFESREVQEEVPGFASDDYTKWLKAEGWGELPEPMGVRGEMYYIPQVSQLPPKYHPTQWIGDRSVEFIRQQKDSSKPWYLYSSYIHPHPPFAPPAPWHKLYRSFKLPLPFVPRDLPNLYAYINRLQNRYKYRDQGIDNQLVRNIKAHYYACISFIDYQIGRILDTLEQTGQLGNTLILFSSDHGEHLGDYNCFGKRSMHDTVARVPMIASMPGRFEGGRRCDKVANLVDIMPTVLAVAGADTSGLKMDGVDLHDVNRGASDRAAVFSQYNAAGKAIYTLVTQDWKYAYSAADHKEYLFDRKGDPKETWNFAGQAEKRPTLDKLRAQALAWVREGGEQAALDGDQWKVYPHLDVSPNPDEGLIIQDTPGFKLNLPGYVD